MQGKVISPNDMLQALRKGGAKALRQAATEAGLGDGNDEVVVSWEAGYQPEYQQLVVVGNVSPKSANASVGSVAASAMSPDNQIAYCVGYGGLVSGSAGQAKWAVFTWTSNIQPSQIGQTVIATLSGVVTVNGYTQFYQFEKTFIIDAAAKQS